MIPQRYETTVSMEENYKKLLSDSVHIDDLQREYLYFLPKHLNRNHINIVFVLHGSTMTAGEMAEMTGFGFNREAQMREDTIVVYPQGYETYWNDCRSAARYAAKIKNLDEVHFFRAIVERVTHKLHLSRSTLYALGYSNGAHMVYKLAQAYPEMFQAYAAICANLPVKENNDCTDEERAVNMMIVNGTADPINPFNGGEVVVDDNANRGEVISTEHTLQHWKELLGQEDVVETKEYMKKHTQEDDTQVVIYAYSSAALAKKVVLVTIENGGHVIPNPYFSHWPKELGKVNRDINLPKYILDFFALKKRIE